MATYDPLDFHGGGYGSSWQFEYDDHGYDRGYGRRSSRSSGYGHGAGAYGGEDYDARSYGAYDRGEPRRSSYEDGYGDRGGYGRSDYYGDSDRRNGFGASSSSYRYGEYRGRDYTDRGYDTRSREYGGTSSYDSRSRGYGGGGDDRSYRGYDRRVELVDGGGHHRDGGDRAARRNGGGRRDGRCSDQHREGRGGSGAGLISGSGYETIGDDITDPHLKAEWSGAAGLRNVKSDDPEVLKTVDVCARPPAPGRNGRTVPLKVNYFGLEIVSGPNQVFKYHVTVERTSDREEDEKYGPRIGEHADGTGAENAEQNTEAQPRPERRPERPLRSLVTSVVNAVLRQNEAEFGGIRVVHDGIAALYSPAMLPWNSKEFKDVSLYPPQPAPTRTAERDGVTRSGSNGPRTFVVKISLVETICMQSLLDHYSDSDVNVMPVLQALDVVARHLACQRLTIVGRDLYTLKETHTLHGGKELCWGYHQAIRKAEDKLVMNLNETSAVFYTPGPLMDLVLSALRVKDPRHIRTLSRQELKNLAHALHKVEVEPTHRDGRPRAIYGVSTEPSDQLLVSIKGKEQTVAEYFNAKYTLRLRFPRLPCVNVGSKRAGKETWLPIELCKVVPGQHCANSDDLDSPAITKLTAVPPATREKNILDRVKKAEFSQDPFLVTFGMKVKLKMEVTNARILEPPCVQYQNTSERPTNGEWSLKDKIMVKGESFDNWGVLILDQVDSSVVRRFARTLCDVGRQRGLPFKKNTEPIYVHQNEHRDADVEELMRICFQRVAERGPPEMLLVVLPDTRSWHYGPVKVMSDTVLGVSCQCVASKNLRKANAAFCANVCLKLNMRLNGKNAVLYDPLPLLSTSPTIVIGADVEHPRPGMGSQPSIAAVVASMDAYSAQYAARVGAQKASNDIQKLPTMLCELFHAYYQLTQRKPEHVVYYRDGVGDGQYSNILQAEMGALRKAFKMISENYSPPITFIVANKRHHTRAFPVDRRDADRKGNVKPGTVIDAGVVDPHRFDFFLFGHSSLQGTSKPCHYTVLYDENKLSVDDIQRLTYHLGYAFSRSTHAVSVAAPVYYANEAAAHARHFLKEVPEDESAESVSGSKFLFAKLHKNVLNKMFFI